MISFTLIFYSVSTFTKRVTPTPLKKKKKRKEAKSVFLKKEISVACFSR